MSLVFKASYRSGKCPECGDPIEQGEEVSYSADGSLLHAECDAGAYWADPNVDEYWEEDEW